MEPQENKQLALRKAINAHADAEAALTDLGQGATETRYAAMLERIRQNARELRSEAEAGDPADRV